MKCMNNMRQYKRDFDSKFEEMLTESKISLHAYNNFYKSEGPNMLDSFVLRKVYNEKDIVSFDFISINFINITKSPLYCESDTYDKDNMDILTNISDNVIKYMSKDNMFYELLITFTDGENYVLGISDEGLELAYSMNNKTYKFDFISLHSLNMDITYSEFKPSKDLLRLTKLYLSSYNSNNIIDILNINGLDLFNNENSNDFSIIMNNKEIGLTLYPNHIKNVNHYVSELAYDEYNTHMESLIESNKEESIWDKLEKLYIENGNMTNDIALLIETGKNQLKEMKNNNGN